MILPAVGVETAGDAAAEGPATENVNVAVKGPATEGAVVDASLESADLIRFPEEPDVYCFCISSVRHSRQGRVIEIQD